MINKNNLEMKTEKKSENIWKTFIPYTPFGWVWVLSNKYIHKYHGSTSSSNAIEICTSFANLFLLGIYSAFSLGAGTPNLTKWSEINEQRKFQEELRITRDYFDKYDLNKNRVLDSTEFLNYYNGEKK